MRRGWKPQDINKVATLGTVSRPRWWHQINPDTDRKNTDFGRNSGKPSQRENNNFENKHDVSDFLFTRHVAARAVCALFAFPPCQHLHAGVMSCPSAELSKHSVMNAAANQDSDRTVMLLQPADITGQTPGGALLTHRTLRDGFIFPSFSNIFI